VGRFLRISLIFVVLLGLATFMPETWASDRPTPHLIENWVGDPDLDPDVSCAPLDDEVAPVPDGQPIVVTIPPGPTFTVGQIPPAWWKTPPYGDAGWKLALRGFMWVQPLARRAYQDGQKDSLKAMIDQVLAFHTENPDPGTATTTSTNNANAWGWDEGSALRRLSAENCLFSLTKDARLKPVMTNDVAVQFGPRFYGPPYHPVHNHGIMADRTVIYAADLLARPTWRNQSMARLKAAAPLAFTPAGTTKEQSSAYHVFNTKLWGWVADDLQAHQGASPSVLSLRAADARAASVAQWLTQPDGKLAVVGDATADPGYPAPTRTERIFRDDTAGLIVGRWSWNDPGTSYYVLRYGPKRWGHGQQERSGVTWATNGLRILVNPGKAVYDVAGNYLAWESSPSSHNVATADKGTFTDGTVSLTGSNSKASWHSWTTTDKLYGLSHVRTTSILRDTHSLVATDTFAGTAGFHQWWHLDPGWVQSGTATAKKLTFTNNGHTLTVTTTGTATVVRGVTRPVAGWNFPDPLTRVPAVQIQIAGAGTATTTFAVA
jgi:hypothetical protein